MVTGKLVQEAYHQNSGVALKVSQGMVKVAEELMYFTQESSWSNGLRDVDVIEISCTTTCDSAAACGVHPKLG